MCGIFGAVSFDIPFNKKDFEKFCVLTDMISYRGPDASGYKGFDSKSKIISDERFNVFFGHRRLSIIDLSSEGNQPLHSDGCWIIYNGEIFNYIELRDELKLKGCVFSTNTDTEVITKVYKNYGVDGFDKLNGMWAFAIYDQEKNIVVLSRDRFSIKPLFYYQLNNYFYFSSEIKQLLPLLDKKEIHFETMQNFLQQGLLEIDENSFFNGIKRIKPKSYLIINLNNNKIQSGIYWNYSEPSFDISYQQAKEKFLELFFDSVKIRLRSDVSLGSLLSGGIDSSAITAVATKLSPNKISTFSIISNEKKVSEEKFIDIFNENFQTNNKKLLVESNFLNEQFDKVLFHQDEPFNYLIVFAHYQLIKTLNENSDIVVILNGQGGDEVMLGYLRFYFFYLKYLYKSRNLSRLFNEIFHSLINRTALYQIKINAAKRYLPKVLLSDKTFLTKKKDLVEVWKFNNLREVQINEIDKFSIPYINRYEDRNSMAFSKEIRLPFLDHRLVDFLINIPDSYKINKGWSKYILRDCISLLPKKIRWRRDKKGFSLPEEKWVKEDLKNEIIKTFSNNESILSQLGFISDRKFMDYFSRFLSGDQRTHSTDISRVYILERWARKYFGYNL
ncbi:MAG: asparagine synthase (glutamine-hydrolyzing) [Ignavibacterium sp.]|nr:asparagine synthase (glutamine-hydrolyzing) [Ignavibacterium sp.]MDW8375657.1 asparagine synthase (glutamine-hydrolyzing) [Ignavibacteriales bacterium]